MQKIRQRSSLLFGGHTSHLAARKILKKSSWKNTHFGRVVDWWFDVVWTGRSSNCSAKCPFFYSSIFSYLSLLDKFFFYALNTLYRVGCRVGNSLFRTKSFFYLHFFTLSTITVLKTFYAQERIVPIALCSVTLSLTKNERFAQKPMSKFPTLVGCWSEWCRWMMPSCTCWWTALRSWSSWRCWTFPTTT